LTFSTYCSTGRHDTWKRSKVIAKIVKNKKKLSPQSGGATGGQPILLGVIPQPTVCHAPSGHGRCSFHHCRGYAHRRYEDALIYEPFEEIPDACRYYLQRESLRNSLAEKAFQTFSRDRETDLLRRALDPRTIERAQSRLPKVTVVQENAARKSWMIEETA